MKVESQDIKINILFVLFIRVRGSFTNYYAVNIRKLKHLIVSFTVHVFLGCFEDDCIKHKLF